MSDKIDEIIDRLIKGGRGSGRRGHKTVAPVSNITRELDPEKKKKLLASDKKAVRGASKDLSHEELQSKIDGHRELSENKFLSPASRESYAAKHKALLSVQKKKGPKPEAPKQEEGIASRPGPFGNINKGGPGSGRKGHTTNHEERNKIAADSIKGSKASEMYPLDSFMTDALDEEGGLDYMLNNEEEFTQKMVDKHVRSVGSVQPEYLKEAVTYSLAGIKAKLGSNKIEKGGPGSGKKKGSGKIEPKHFEPNPNLRDKDKQLDRLTPEQVKARKAERDRRMKEDSEARKRGEEPNYDRPSNRAHLDLDKSLDTLFYMKQLAEEGRLKPKNKRNVRKGEKLEKKQGVPKGVDPAKHERCVMDVKASGKDKSSAFAICNSSMNKADEDMEKVLPLAGKTIFRTIQNLVKPAGGSDGSEADSPKGGYDGASVAHGSGGAKQEKGPGKKMRKSLFEHILEKGGIGSGRKGHHSIGRDYSDDEHDSVFEDNQFDNVGEREAYKEKMIAAANREEEKAAQRIREREGKRDVTSNFSRKMHAPPEKKSLLSRIGQKIIDAI